MGPFESCTHLTHGRNKLVLHYTLLERHARVKHSGILDPFISYSYLTNGPNKLECYITLRWKAPGKTLYLIGPIYKLFIATNESNKLE